MFSNLVKSIIVSLLILFTILAFSVGSQAAEEVNVPKDELARESVYPVFDYPVSVKNRNIQDSETFDIGLFGGSAITEPIFNTTRFGLSLNYHFNEAHALGLMFSKNSNGLSKDAQGLKDDFGLDFARAPAPESALLLDYNYKAYYGKLSVTKTGVVNTSIYFTGQAGLIKYVHKSYPAISGGVGERFYLSKHVALKVDLRLQANSAPVPFKTNALKSTDPVPTFDSFDEKLTLSTNLEVGLNYLF